MYSCGLKKKKKDKAGFGENLYVQQQYKERIKYKEVR